MDVHLTADQKAFARRAIESGRLHSEQDAVQEALALWEERERQRMEFLLTLDAAKASLTRGEGRVIPQESVQQLAQEVKERMDPILRKYTSFEEMKADEYRYWQSRPVHERMDAVEEMIQTAFALKGWEIEPDVPRIQRPFVRLPCPWR